MNTKSKDHAPRNVASVPARTSETERTKVHTAVLQEWLETERGWGQRPDGWSLHLTDEDRVKYIDAYWKRMPGGLAPDTYTRPCGDPTFCEVTDDLFAELEANKDKHGVRIWGRGDLVIAKVTKVSRKDG